MDITLEKVDQVRERTGASYKNAKKALEECNGDVLEAIIYLEDKSIEADCSSDGEFNDNAQKIETIEELKVWLKDLINKGNVTRIKVSKDGKKLVDVPVNAGIAAGVIAIVIPPILAFVVVAAVVTQVTIEITKADGTVEIVNKYISEAVSEAKDKASDFADKVKEKVQDVNLDGIKVPNKFKEKEDDESNTFTYTVNFDDEDGKN
ncbi:MULTISPECIES: DUF4342 domain-containing protein [unclassified Clostridium]|uniref:DUF4342 domain-containing protein n=1 Tax=Clostridium TaxID=1485 RepID=UPI001C8B6DAF|nr:MULTISPECIES: DUF4342 domain-containing protein [unclassified Clostridium]MBX9138026.1 DUF4342 domain-containing protein [Clostridium sp. K12(2020)]MBX9144536.1 DUF4342 domain-containing protein [Clostridium sp. K13]MDU2289959.1 DUF4342 domain-containing protein [Clostridium celatum]